MNLHSTTQPPVSVAICTFNGAKFLKQQIDSILTQSYPNIAEIICVDDSSSDNTLNILHDYQSKDQRFKIFTNQSNLGYIKNFEKALTLCSEEYIALSDQDDLWYPNKIERLMSNIGDNLMIYSDTEYIDENNHKIGKKLSSFRNLGVCTSCLNLALFNGISSHTMIIKKELVRMAVPFSLKVPHDYWLSFAAAKKNKIAFINETLVGYRQHTCNALGGFGLGGVKRKDPLTDTYDRLMAFLSLLEEDYTYERNVIEQIADKYKKLTLKKRILKVILFLKHKNELLFFKKHCSFRKIVYCISMFWRII